MDLTTLLKDIAIPVVTILAAYLGARWGRTTAFRERIYVKQMEAFEELLAATDELHDAVRQSGTRLLKGPHGFQQISLEQALDAWRADILHTDHQLHLKSRKHQVYIPKEMENALWDYRGSLSDLLNKMRVSAPEMQTSVSRRQLAAECDPYYNNVYNVARQCLGTDQLIREMNSSFSRWTLPKPSWPRIPGWKRSV